MSTIHLIGIVGSNLDRGVSPERWGGWRPSVALCQQEDLLIHSYTLLYFRKDRELARLLVADIATVSPETTVHLQEIHIRDPWDFKDVYEVLYDVVRDLPKDLPKEEGIDFLVNVTTGTHVMQICLFLLTESRQIPGKLIQAHPPARANQGGIGKFSIIDLDLSKYDRLAARFEQARQDDISFLKSGISTRNADFNRLIHQIERVALRSSEPMLLLGPTGAGKSRLARRLYELGQIKHRISGAFVEANCATLKGVAAMSTLFGHQKGAYTGATSDRPGLLRAADQGMLFLDEIGELGLDEQAMLLQAVEEKKFYPLGADAPVQSRFQLVCGTNRDLAREVSEGRFRADLLARIDCWTFRLPGLSERREDIAPNVHFELEEFSRRTGRRVSFNREALSAFLTFAESPAATWNGNFRDLNSAVMRMATLAPSGRIRVEEVIEEIERLQFSWQELAGGESPWMKKARELMPEEQWKNTDLFDRLQLASVLEVCEAAPSLAAAGRTLFAASRLEKSKTNDSDRLRKFLQRFGILPGDLLGHAKGKRAHVSV